ncbi:helix-turn-helix domain-containing protein [Spirillospora sp. NPDC029432]|uniref:TetR/AcrR family transcriptional regulator n=1 Tax=Spirillospora sp. NPDC029432 TaxID=3154599 RepID=UPI00345249EE
MGETRRRRRDVVANRARIIEAAESVLREQGLDADMRTIAQAAGVGIGTLYRHFPTREDLVHEITGVDLARLAEQPLPPDLPAADALRHFFTTALGNLAGRRAMVDLLAGAKPGDADLKRCVEHLTGVGRAALARSEDDRTLAADVTASDIAYQFLALARVVQLAPEADIGHHVDLVLRGMERGRGGRHSADVADVRRRAGG